MAEKNRKSWSGRAYVMANDCQKSGRGTVFDNLHYRHSSPSQQQKHVTIPPGEGESSAFSRLRRLREPTVRRPGGHGGISRMTESLRLHAISLRLSSISAVESHSLTDYARSRDVMCSLRFRLGVRVSNR